jgi:hypothetical protein
MALDIQRAVVQAILVQPALAESIMLLIDKPKDYFVVFLRRQEVPAEHLKFVVEWAVEVIDLGFSQ